MLKKRLIPVLLIRDGTVVQSVQFKLTNVIHWDPVIAIDFFNRWAADEIIVLDVDRAKKTEGREKFYDIVYRLSKKCFTPLSVGGWIESIDEIRELLQRGADKVIINTKFYEDPAFVTEAAKTFGTQCIVVSIDAKKITPKEYRVVIDRGRKITEKDPAMWAYEAEQRGAGEVFLNCIDHDGFRQGYDLELLKRVRERITIPLIAMGGVFTWQHLVDGIAIGGADAVAAANIFHYTEHSIKKAKRYLKEKGIDVR